MSVFNRLYDSIFYLGHSNFLLHNTTKWSKFNFKYRKLYVYYQVRNATTSGLYENVLKDSINSSFVTFEKMIESRRNEAKRTIGVQVQSEESCKDLYQYCKKIAPINAMFHYKVQNNNYFLIEFSEESSEILERCTHINDAGSIPAKSPFVWFKASKNGGKLYGKTSDELPLKHSVIPTQTQLNEWIEQTCSLSDCMRVLYEGTRLDELGLRLRLLTARQIEMALEGLFPNIAVLPFGSTVNGLGKAGCDLDLLVQQDYPFPENNKMKNGFSRLILHHKTAGYSSTTRQHIQRQMEVMADIIQLYLPGCSSVKRILQARVPIVKFSNEFTGTDCDISMTNMTGVYMSELLYILGSLDPLSKPLVFTIKQWAQATGLTNPTPGRWITNFTITLLTLFYLQVIQRIPPVDHLRTAADAKDKRITEEIDCTFIRDITRLNWQPLHCNSHQELTVLLKGFFEYYTVFDFSSSGISLGSGKIIPKPDFSPLYVVNPLERSANVSKNVSLEEVERLRIALRDAAWCLDTAENEQKAYINLITSSLTKSDTSPKKYYPNRMVSIKRLFNDR